MKILLIITGAAMLVSFLKDRQKTLLGLRKGTKMFLNILPDFLVVLVLAAILLALVPETVIVKLLGKEAGVMGMITAALVGAVALIPGIIAYPLAAVLRQSGVSLEVLAVFITTLMMVGIVTLPVERRFFGWKVALYRNGLSFIGALAVGLLMGIFL
jgi:uncharacterized membrane protein YraQ (UPF0718 family)